MSDNPYGAVPEYRPTDIDSVDIRDDFMFSYVMRDRNICTQLLQYLLPEHRIDRIEYCEVSDVAASSAAADRSAGALKVDIQKALAESFNKRGVRLDAYVDDGRNIYNVEMQTTRQTALPRRARLYQAHMDINQLERGQQYDLLRPSFVIFICTFDPFGRGLYLYSYRNACRETGEELGDAAYKLFFNTTGTRGEISDPLREILRYMNDPASYPVDRARLPLIRSINEAVNDAKMDDDWRHQYMTYQVHQRDAELRGRAIGLQEGKAIGLQEGKAIGLQEGEKRNQLQTARRMLLMGMAPQLIAQLTALDAAQARA